VNPDLARLHRYPLEKLLQFFVAVTPNPKRREIRFSIGEAHHATPAFIKKALIAGFGGLASYPTTRGMPAPVREGRGEMRFVSRARDFHIVLAEAT
jgi:N-succinyldiaminopimelate aminotransferase